MVSRWRNTPFSSRDMAPSQEMSYSPWRAKVTRMAWQSGAIVLLPTLVLHSAAANSAGCSPKTLGVSRTLPIGTDGGLQVGLKTYPQSLALEDHEIVLTFDDGPAPQTTAAILDTLAKECVKATFFIVGRNAEAMPALVKREIAEGHTVGHHSYSHPAVTLRQLNEQAAREEILKGIAADDKAAYGTAVGAPKVPFFRFPGFADTPQLVEWLAARNIAVFGADLWASDWLDLTPEEELALVLDRLDRERRGVLLLHDTKHQTAAMLPDLLRELKQRGYKIVHIVPGTQPNTTRAAPEGWSSETDKIITEVFAKAHLNAKARAHHKESSNALPIEESKSGATPKAGKPDKQPSPGK
jgi:peptidoglycan/xylan/chitin deacetylase (PgdA/CDA1 family)